MAASKEFAQILALLQDASHPFPARDLYQFSDLSRENTAALQAAWPEVEVERRRDLTEDLNEISEANFEVNFDAVFRLGLEDEDALVRAAAIRGLWESEDPALIAPFIDFLLHDSAVEVRAAAASALGRFVYLGEVEDLPAPQAQRVEEALLSVLNGSDEADVRRRALEAIAFSDRSGVPDLIEQAYRSHDEQWRASAVFAMGRSADPRWGPAVRAELHSEQPEMRFEAARAAGELELEDTVTTLAELAEDPDPQVHNAAIWSLSQVGGPEAARVLQHLLDEADEDEVDYLEEALENLAFTNDIHNFSLLDIDGEADEDDDSRLN